MTDRTADTLFDGALICNQHRDGYRFSIDAVLLAHFCRVSKKRRHILDLCCGSGIIALILSYRHQDVTVHGIEIQPSLVSLALDNVYSNKMDERITVTRGDAGRYTDCLSAERYDLVTCNPPYRKVGSGRLSVSDEALTARHEITAGIREFVRAAAFAVKNRGKVCFIYPSERSALLIHTMENNRLAVKRIRPVYSYPGSTKARLVLVEAVKNGGEECSILPPLYIYQGKNRGYSNEVELMYQGNHAG